MSKWNETIQAMNARETAIRKQNEMFGPRPGIKKSFYTVAEHAARCAELGGCVTIQSVHDDLEATPDEVAQ